MIGKISFDRATTEEKFMSTEQKTPEVKGEVKDEKSDLPIPWQRIQGAIWLLGLALLAWQGWWWPGILVLLAVSGLFQGAVQLYLTRGEADRQLSRERAKWLPATCPQCGAPISVAAVRWTGPDTADCPYCQANLKRPA
jgi:hypothetical protein